MKRRGLGNAPLAGGAKRTDTEQRRRRTLLTLVAISAAGLGLLAHAGGILDSLELSSIQARFAIRGTQRPPDDIVIVGIDSPTITAPNGPGHPPFPLPIYTTLLGKLSEARLIGIDIDFAERSVPAAVANPFIEAMRATGGRVVLGASYVVKNTHGEPGTLGGWAGINAADAHAGDSQLPTDSKGALLLFPYSVLQLTSFSVVLAEQYRHRPVPLSEFPGGYAPIDFAGPPKTFKAVSFVKVLDGAYPRAYFRGKIVLIGETAPILGDVHTTAIDPSGEMSGPEVIANELWTVLRGNPLRFAPGVLNVLLIALLGLVVPLSRIRLRPTVTIALAGALAVLYALVAQLAFDSGTIVSFVYPLLALALGTASANAVDGILDRRERVNLKSELSRLPSDSSAFFVSYRRDQSSWPADALEKALSARFGSASVFQDSASIAAGEEWPKRIADAVSKCNVMLVLIGPYWLEARTADGSRRIDDPRDWVRLEIETALDAGCVVVPILLDGAVQPKAEQLPASLQPLILRQAMALTTENWNAQLDALLSSIHDGRVREFLASERAAQGGAESARPTGSPED